MYVLERSLAEVSNCASDIATVYLKLLCSYLQFMKVPCTLPCCSLKLIEEERRGQVGVGGGCIKLFVNCVNFFKYFVDPAKEPCLVKSIIHIKQPFMPNILLTTLVSEPFL